SMFTFSPGGPLSPPTLMSITPSGGSPGTAPTITLAGTNFEVDGTTVNVSGSGLVVSNVAVQSATVITVTMNIDSGAAPGQYPVTVTSAGGTSASIPFSVVPSALPTLTSLSGGSGALGTTVTVNLRGTNLNDPSLTILVSGTGVSAVVQQVLPT